ncbi:MAG TPA: PDZ domain-containing protein, partial [Kofleriaceae bacterium]|nr:PDZ domain-containing protein [Kofleriaceae bacterium]
GSGRRLSVLQASKREWQIEPGAAEEIRIRYRVYGHELTVRTNHIDRTHAFLHGPAVFLFPSAARDWPCELEVAAPAGWPIETALAGEAGRYRAADVDELLDCPLHLGAALLRELHAGGRPIRLAIWGHDERSGPFGLDDLVRDLGKVIDSHAARLGDLPCAAYTFILMLSPGAYGGLEHRSSSANLSSPFAFAQAKTYQELVELLSHELFHAWNGKRLRPAAFDRFDYGRENYTRCLWVIEGLTSYYDRLAVRRAGVMTAGQYLGKLLEDWGRMQSVPGRFRHSLEDSSWNAWQKLYKPDESNINTSVSYYLKGSLVMAALDLELRRRSEGEIDLDRVLIHMWREFGARELGYPEDVRPAFEAATGLELADFFARHIHGREDPDLKGGLAALGLDLTGTWDGHKKEEPSSRPPVWLGVVLQPGGGRVVAGVLDGGPAERAGLSPGDEIVALNRYQVAGEADLRGKLIGRAAGEAIALAVFRRGRLEMLDLELEHAPHTRLELLARAEAGPLARKLYRDWMGEDLPGSGIIASAAVGGAL